MEKCLVHRSRFELTLQIRASHKLEKLIQKDDWEGKFQHHHPLLHVQMSELEDHLHIRGAACSNLKMFKLKWVTNVTCLSRSC